MRSSVRRPEEAEAGLQDEEGARAQQEPARADGGLVDDHLVGVVEGAEFPGELVEVEAEEVRAQGLGREPHGVGELDQLARERDLAGRLAARRPRPPRRGRRTRGRGAGRSSGCARARRAGRPRCCPRARSSCPTRRRSRSSGSARGPRTARSRRPRSPAIARRSASGKSGLFSVTSAKARSAASSRRSCSLMLSPRAGLQRLAVLAEHRAEVDVLEPGQGPAGPLEPLAGGEEELLEVVAPGACRPRRGCRSRWKCSAR